MKSKGDIGASQSTECKTHRILFLMLCLTWLLVIFVTLGLVWSFLVVRGDVKERISTMQRKLVLFETVLERLIKDVDQRKGRYSRDISHATKAQDKKNTVLQGPSEVNHEHASEDQESSGDMNTEEYSGDSESGSSEEISVTRGFDQGSTLTEVQKTKANESMKKNDQKEVKSKEQELNARHEERKIKISNAENISDVAINQRTKLIQSNKTDTSFEQLLVEHILSKYFKDKSKNNQSELQNLIDMSLVCHNKYTEWNTTYSRGVSRFLASHDVNCQNGELLQSFHMRSNGDHFFPLYRYEYVCCKITSRK